MSGLLLVHELGLGLLDEPWLIGMWVPFLFELIEGNTVTRIQFRRTLRESRKARERGQLTLEVRSRARTTVGQLAHFLDVPLFLVIVYCGAVRPSAWSDLSDRGCPPAAALAGGGTLRGRRAVAKPAPRGDGPWRNSTASS